jgi:DNA-binding LacI/PurR family transcriptional regulator
VVNDLNTEKQILYIIAENQYSNTTWYSRVIEGIYKEAARRQMKVVLCADEQFRQLPKGTIPILLGSSLPFITEYINLCILKEYRPIVAGFEVFQNSQQVSYITINRQQAMSEVVKALLSCGARHIALLGVNSSIQTDMLRYNGWAAVVRAYGIGDIKKDVFYSDSGLPACMDAFWEHYREYDAVACANDYYAAYLCSQAAQKNVSIPETLMVTGFGNTQISQYTHPTLTTVALNLSSVGIQTINLFRSLSKNPDLLSCTATLKSEIIYRNSTRWQKQPLPGKAIFTENITSAFEPTFESHLKNVYALENTLMTMDDTDRKIISGLLQKESYNRLAENLFLSDTAFKYRLYKLFSATNCKNRTELTELFRNYIPEFDKNLH